MVASLAKVECSKCGTEKIYTEFSKNPSCKRGYDKVCKDCRNEARRGKRQKEAFRTRARNYGLTPEELSVLLTDAFCGICDSSEELVVDHNHDTGEVRGILCTHCNKALGQFKDSKELLSKAITWLEEKGTYAVDTKK